MSLIKEIQDVPEERRYDAWQYAMTKKTRREHYALGAHLELTPLCTLNCKMCYVHLTREQAEQEGGILTGDKWIELARQCNEMGIYSLTLTGGECTMHPDFLRIYESIYDMGIVVGLITNCTLMSDEVVELFRRKPPAYVTITMYGFSEETYERACGNGKAFGRCSTASTAFERPTSPSICRAPSPTT